VDISTATRIIQSTTLILAIVAQLLMLVAIRRGILAWRYTILPGVLFMGVALFYVYILSAVEVRAIDNTLVSSALRLYEFIIICVMLGSWVWYKKKKSG
jgi:hypothetical protein